MIALVLGGARSGKSRHAARVAKELTGAPVIVATSRIFDADHAARIARHRADRGPEWTTLEEEKAIARPDLAGRVVVVDCATLWLTNFFLDSKSDVAAAEEGVRAELARVAAIDATWIFVSNELGLAPHAATEVGRKFVDLQGFLNQDIAARATAVTLMVAGIPLPVKGGDMVAALRAGGGDAVTDRTVEPQAIARFSDEARKAVYDVIALRRDVRHFDPERPVEDDALLRVLGAAHAAPSVGLSQPWGFVVVRSARTRERVRESFLRCRAAEAARFPEARREKYLSYRLEGILEAPLNLCVAVDLRSRGEAILGTTVQPESVRASACCAVQNLWLAARAEGLGVGWVSIVEPAVLRGELALPPGVEPIAYVCIGHPRAFRVAPMLEELGWSARRPLGEVLHEERWTDPPRPVEERSSTPSARPRASIAPVSTLARDAARAHQDELTKPRGSLGRLEELAVWYAAARGAFPVEPPREVALAVFLADHGVVVEGVSAYGSQVTAGMACNVMSGGAAVSVLARRGGVKLVAVDVGIAGDLSAAPREPAVPLVRARVRAGTANFRVTTAMTIDEAYAAMEAGARVADDLHGAGSTLAGVGEIGIGNTTSGAALVACFAGVSPEEACGRGSGIDDATLARKIGVVTEALALHRPGLRDPIRALAAVGGLELAAIAGFLLRAAAHRIPVVLDGFLAAAAALVARAIDPAVTGYLVASHASAEHGSRAALASLGLEPLLSLDLRLGEGTGALLGIELVRSAVEIQARMATFATAGVVR